MVLLNLVIAVFYEGFVIYLKNVRTKESNINFEIIFLKLIFIVFKMLMTQKKGLEQIIKEIDHLKTISPMKSLKSVVTLRRNECVLTPSISDINTYKNKQTLKEEKKKIGKFPKLKSFLFKLFKSKLYKNFIEIIIISNVNIIFVSQVLKENSKEKYILELLDYIFSYFLFAEITFKIYLIGIGRFLSKGISVLDFLISILILFEILLTLYNHSEIIIPHTKISGFVKAFKV